MKNTLLLFTFVFGLSCSAFASACIPGDTLADYITAGSCTVGSDLTFSFDATSYSPSGSVIIPASDVRVTPVTDGTETGLRFNAPWFALSGGFLDSFISFTITCNGCMLEDWELTTGGAGSSGDGAVNVTETSPQVTKGLSQTTINGVTTGISSGTFAPVGSITVSKDILITGGDTPNSLTQVSAVSNLFSTTTTTMTPEPSMAMLCVGLLCLIPATRRRIRTL